MSKTIRLKPGRDKSLKRRHPWIFSGAVQSAGKDLQPGDTVEVLSADGQWLARAAYSPQSQIQGRVWTFRQELPVGGSFFLDRLRTAMVRREHIAAGQGCTAYRVCYAESDGLPGLIVDRYDRWLVTQFLSAGAERWKDDIHHALEQLFPDDHILERSDSDMREKEGLHPRVTVVKGHDPGSPIEVREGGARFLVDLMQGHKTGFYIDQRENRALLAEFCTGKQVLNCFSYTGGFGIMALTGGAAHVTNIDTSAEALELAGRNFRLNGFNESQYSLEMADVFSILRKYRDSARQFDVVVLDPPKFVSSISQMKGGTRGYKDINLLAMKLLKPGGILFTFSCSGLVGSDLFQKILADAACDAGRNGIILHRLCQSADHPVNLFFPEGLYLKGLVLNVEC